jgi:MYXO-CTERM domain-containing protein
MTRRLPIAATLSAVLLALLVARGAHAEQLVRKPYLQIVSPTSATVVWTTDVAADSLVRYGSSPSSLTQSAPLAASVTQHEVALSGLSPATRYYYSVGSAGGTLAGGDATHYFETAPTTGTKKKLRAWIVGDSGTGDSNQDAVRDAMLSFVGHDRPDLFLHMGDMAYSSGTTAQFTQNFFAAYATVLENTPVWPTMGNHEGLSANSNTQSGPYYTAYVLPKAAEAGGVASGTEAYYSFDYANVHFIVLNSHDIPNGPGSAMLTWLTADLAATTQDWLIAYFHHPAYTKGTHNSDTEGQLIAMRQNVLPVLEAGGVDLVLAGHSHIYERSFLVDGAYNTPTTAAGHIVDPGDGKLLGSGPYKKPVGAASHAGAVYVVAGHGGASLGGTANHPLMVFSELAFGSCILDVDDNRVSLVNVRADGELTDRFAMIKGNGILVAAPDGGETIGGGSTYDIRWATVGSAPSVKIELSLDDGAHYTTIAASAPNTGTYAWAVPAVDTASALVRVTSTQNPAMHDESNAAFTIASSVPMTVIPHGDVWKYHDQGQDLGTAWLDASYDDSAWAAGPAQLGYGDGDEATVIADTPVRPSYYFRKTITLDAPVVSASLDVLHDDGVAVWINGAPVFEEYMGNGTSYDAFASSTSSENEVDVVPVPLSPSPFVVGENVVAVMVKQAGLTSSDVSFDLSLDVTLQSSTGTGGAGPGGAGGGGSTGGVGGSTSIGGAGVGGSGAEGGSGGEGGKGSTDSGGCGCEVRGAPVAPPFGLALAVLALARAARRRRARS